MPLFWIWRVRSYVKSEPTCVELVLISTTTCREIVPPGKSLKSASIKTISISFQNRKVFVVLRSDCTHMPYTITICICMLVGRNMCKSIACHDYTCATNRHKIEKIEKKVLLQCALTATVAIRCEIIKLCLFTEGFNKRNWP